MKKTMSIMACALAACACVAAAEQRWRDDLWLGRGGFWRARVGVTVENTSGPAAPGGVAPEINVQNANLVVSRIA